MKNLFKPKENPYDDAVAKMDELQKENPNTPNLAKLAYYCGCDVEDLVKELEILIDKR